MHDSAAWAWPPLCLRAPSSRLAWSLEFHEDYTGEELFFSMFYFQLFDLTLFFHLLSNTGACTHTGPQPAPQTASPHARTLANTRNCQGLSCHEGGYRTFLGRLVIYKAFKRAFMSSSSGSASSLTSSAAAGVSVATCVVLASSPRSSSTCPVISSSTRSTSWFASSSVPGSSSTSKVSLTISSMSPARSISRAMSVIVFRSSGSFTSLFMPSMTSVLFCMAPLTRIMAACDCSCMDTLFICVLASRSRSIVLRHCTTFFAVSLAPCTCPLSASRLISLSIFASSRLSPAISRSICRPCRVISRFHFFASSFGSGFFARPTRCKNSMASTR
mmetsp:Transcript_43951/g.138144  ORF Transcript_43951/g.138144 Transcript_43951/m.138144 type:complete len:331 (+) Transcript_43951:527-1519(+)